jgi:hypothetical protein
MSYGVTPQLRAPLQKRGRERTHFANLIRAREDLPKFPIANIFQNLNSFATRATILTPVCARTPLAEWVSKSAFRFILRVLF